jgi:hypothetical protein
MSPEVFATDDIDTGVEKAIAPLPEAAAGDWLLKAFSKPSENPTGPSS